MRRITTSAVRNALGAATRLGLFVSCVSLAGCDIVASSSGTACEGCRITRSIVGWIGVGVVKGAPLDMAVTSSGNFVVLDGRSAAEFDSQGAFLSRLPAFTRGDAAGPYATVATVGVDSLILVDNDSRVLRIVGPARTLVDSVVLPSSASVRAVRVLDWPHRIVFAGHALRREGLFLASVEDGFLVIDASFDPLDIPTAVRAPGYRLSHRHAGTVWAVETHSYIVLQLGPDGTLLERIERNPRWFVKPGRGRPRGVLRSTVKAIGVDEQSRLWVYSIKPTNAAAPAWRAPEARRPGGTVDQSLDELYETVVEVLEPDGRTLLATGTIPGYLVGTAADGRAFFYQRNPAGQSGISVQELRLHVAPSPAPS